MDDKVIKSTWVHPDTQVSYTFYGTDGPKTPAQFEEARDQFYATQTTPPGVTALKTQSVQDMVRGGFEAVNQPVQQAAHALSQSAEAGYRSMQQDAGVLNPHRYLPDVGSQLPRFLASQVETPEKAALTAALTLSGIGPLGKALAQTTGPLPTIARSLIGATGVGTASALAGTGATESVETPTLQRASMAPVFTAALIAGSEGALGLIAKGFGLDLSNTAIRQVREDIVTAMRKQYPQFLPNQDDALAAYASTQKGFEAFIRAGIKGFKADGDAMAQSFISDLNSAMPRSLGKVAQRRLETKLSEYNTEATKILDNLVDTEIRNKGNIAIRKIEEDITRIVGDEFVKGKNVTPDILSRLNDVWMRYRASSERLKDGAEVFAMLREAGPGFKNLNLQRVLSSRPGTTVSPLTEDVIQAAFRGGPTSQTDAPLLSGLGTLGNFLGMPLGRALSRVPLGTHYAGTVRQAPSYVPFDIMTANEIKNFMTREQQ